VPKYPVMCLIAVLLAAPAAYAANVRLQVEGLSGELEKNVRVRLSSITPEEVGTDGRFRARVDEAVRQGLRALGYYQPTIEFTLDDRPGMSRPVLHAKVNPGEPVRIAGANIVLEGGAKTDEDYLALVKKDRPTIGEILNHGKYDSFKGSLTGLALRKGYFDADMTKSQLGVAEDLHKAFWDIDFNSGERYRFGKVKIHRLANPRRLSAKSGALSSGGLLQFGGFGRAEPPFVRHQLVQLGGGIP
jgi:Outer membrane protein